MSDVIGAMRQASQAIQAGRLDQARAILQRAIQKAPNDPSATNALAIVLHRMGQTTQALFYARKAHAAVPSDPEIAVNLANLLSLSGDTDGAISLYRRVLAGTPLHAGATIGVARTLLYAGRLSEAEQACRAGLEGSPGRAELVDILVSVMRKQGRMADAVALMRQDAALQERNPAPALRLAHNLNYVAEIEPREVFDAHVRFGRLMDDRHGALMRARRHRPDDPDRRIRIGFLSPDLREHSIASFIEPILAGLDRRSFSVACYFTDSRSDQTTERLRRLCDVWRDSATMSDDVLCRQIETDRTDILIELSGLTAGLRLEVLVRKPAPLQISYLGYPHSMGMSCIDHRIVDSRTDPPGESDSRSVERLVRIDPCFLCYKPPLSAPEVEPGPQSTGRPLTFGSFNALFKWSGSCVDLWARVLAEIPGSRLILKNVDLSLEESRRAASARLHAAGIAPDRFELRSYAPNTREHLAQYRDVDIALDTLPYHGTTTTCEALLMGVPVVTLVGPSHASRVGLSVLANAGFPEWAATTPDGFIATCAALARDAQALGVLRQDLRARLLASTLCDSAAFTSRFGSALRGIWRSFARVGGR